MDLKIVSVNKKPKALSREQLNSLSKEELIDKVIQLEAHNAQLKNLLQKKLEPAEFTSKVHERNLKKRRQFDFSGSHKRHILLKFFYFGWDYQGFACQEDSITTIEYHLFNALRKTCLIESRETSNYNRCGRTDKGVSAFGQVISIDIRSRYPESEQMLSDSLANEIDYCTMLNRVLPKDIRCVAWMPLHNKQYSARFDCNQRTYRYFFPVGNLNIETMQRACEFLAGTHDFRNLCKMDVNNGVTNFTRKILSANICACRDRTNVEDGYQMYYLEIISNAFLWHQIRCIMAVLTLIGQGNEEPDVMKDLLDVERNPCKPQYSLAAGLPLNLYSCEFKEKSSQASIDCAEDMEVASTFTLKDTTDWQLREENLQKVIEELQISWSNFNIQATMMRETIGDIIDLFSKNFETKSFKNQANVILQGAKQKVYQKLLTRKRCESLENRVDHYVKKQRLIVTDSSATS